MSSSGRGGQRGRGGKDGGGSTDRQSSTRGRSRSSRSGRSNRGPKQPTASSRDSPAPVSESLAEQSLSSSTLPPPPSPAAGTGRREDGLVPGAGLLALQALAAAQNKSAVGTDGTVGSAIPVAVAKAAEKAVAGGRNGGATREEGRGGGGGGKNRGKARAGGGGGGGFSGKDTGFKGRGSASAEGRGGAVAAVATAAKTAPSSRGRGKGGVDDGRGRSAKVGSGVKKDPPEGSGRPQLSEAEQRKRSEESKKALAAQQEQRKKAEEERRRKAEEDRRAREEQRARREAEERERKRRAEADAHKKELEEKKALEARKRLEERRKRAEEVRRKAKEEAARKEEEARRKEEEKRREAERRRLEEARALEEEKRQKEAEQERARREFEAQMEAVSQLDQLRKEEQARWELRAKHTPAALKASREAHEASKSKLKSDLKRTTAFTKKVKTLSEDQRSSLTKEVEGLNLSRYVSEVADAVAENRLKSSDVPVAVHLCCLMHQRYAEFADDLVPKLATPLLSPALEDEREEKENLRRKRSSLRLLTELHASGVFDGSRLIAKIVQALCGQDAKEKRRQRPMPSSGDLRRRDQPTVTAVPPPLREGDVVLLAAFVRTAGEDMIGVLQRKTVNMLQQAGEMGKLEREPIVDADVKDRLRSLVDGVFDSLCAHLERAHEQMGRLEKKMERDRLTNGSLTDEKEKNLEESRKAYEALLGNVSSLASSLNRDMPQLPEEEDEEEAGGISLWEGGVGGDRSGYTGPFEESERSFYEDLPDLLNTYPPNLLGLTEEEAEKLREEERAKQKERANAANTNAGGEGGGDGETEGGQVVESGDDALTEEMKGLALGDGEERGNRGGDEEADAGGGDGKGDGGASDEEEYAGKNGGGTGEGEGDGDDAEEGGDHVTRNARLTLMLEDELPNCHNQERVDEFAKNFCYVNSKGARKKLVAALFNVPRQALDLLPMYSRLVAILDKAMKTIAPALLDELKSHFRYFLRKKAPGQIDHRIKNVRYIGELVKFRVAAPVVAFHCLKACVDDFSSGAVQTMCALLETCGRFLFRQKLTHQRTKSFLTVMLRIKKAKNLDSRLEALIDNAFYTCCPPERPQRAAKVRTPLQLYVRHLMMERLRDDAEVVEGVIKQLRKLPWQDPEVNVESEVLRASLRLCRSRYPCIHLAADVLSGLARYQDRVAVKVVDMMLEELRRGIELPGRGRDSQRLVGYARLLAELYNYAVVGSPTIFETLHLLMDSGHEVPVELKQPRPADPKNPTKALMMPPPLPPWARFDPRIRSPTDPPGDCLRIRLVVSILEGCGSYFVRGGGLTKLSKFLSVFQRYLFCKERLPAGTEFAVLDLVEDLEAGARAARDRDRAKSQESAPEGKGSSKGKGRGRKGKEEEDADGADDGPILPRHRSWEDAQAAVLEADRAWDEDNSRRMAKIAKLLGKEKAEAGNDGCDGDDDDDDDDEREEDDEEEEEDDRRGSGSEGEEGGLEDDTAKRGGKRQAEEASEGVPTDEAEDDVVLHGGGRAERTEEDGAADEEFEALLSKTMSESVEKTKIARATTQVMGHMAVPMVLKNTNVKRATQETPLTGGTGVAFKLLKRGNKGKMEAQEVMVPATTSLAMQVSRNEEANREENSIIKARVLAYEANMEEAILAQESGTVPLPEDYTQFIPKVHNAPLHHPEGGKAGGKSGGGRGGGKKR